jgi:hypothetical protein
LPFLVPSNAMAGMDARPAATRTIIVRIRMTLNLVNV